jgi:hypothetical protein
VRNWPGRRRWNPLNGFFVADQLQFLSSLLQDIDRAELRLEGARIAQAEELRRLRDDMLRRLNAREVFPAGAALRTGPDGKPDPRPVVVAVTDAELVVLDADPQAPEEEIARIPRNELSGVRLLDEHGEVVPAPPSEVEEMDLADRRYVVWVDRAADGEAGGHAFVFLAWSMAAEAERDFRRQLPA